MKKTIYNSATIVSVKVYDFEKIEDIEYHAEKLGWFGSRREFWGYTPAGFHNYAGRWTLEELTDKGCFDEKVFVKDNEVFIYPHVTVSFSNGKTHDAEFDSLSKAKLFAEEVRQRVDSKLLNCFDWYEFVDYVRRKG